MKVLIAHDHKFYEKAGRYYGFNGQPFITKWPVYLTSFDRIMVAGRSLGCPDEKRLEHLAVSNNPNITFVMIPSFYHPAQMLFHRAQAMRELCAALATCDALIAVLPSELGALAVYAAQKMKKPWAVEVVGCAWDALWNHGTWQGKVYAPFAEWRTRRLIKNSRYTWYVTADYLQRRYVSTGKTIHCSDVELPETDDAVLAKRLQRTKIRTSPFRIGMIGTVTSNIKGIGLALQALHEMRQTAPAFEFLIVGEGDADRWQHRAEQLGLGDRVFFQGTLSHREDVFHWLDQLDLYIQPSYSEGMPRAVLEAMSRGCPVIGSRIGGIPEVLPEECLHTPGSWRELEALLQQAVSHPDWLCEQAAYNFELAKKYGKDRLEPIRENFWNEFARYAATFRG